MKSGETLTLTRDCAATQIPSGVLHPLPAGSKVRLMQALGGSYTVMTEEGYMVRLDAKDADALGLVPADSVEPAPTEFSEKLVCHLLRPLSDPQIPPNIIDILFIY